MRLILTTIALAPVLFNQGRRVKKTMVRVPEPEGQRSGHVGEGRELSVLILGDSAAAGVGVGKQQDALAGQLIGRLSKQYHVAWQFEATSGHTTQQVIEHIKGIKAHTFDVVITSVGVNDVTKLMPENKWIALQEQLIAQIKMQFEPKLLLMTSVPPMQHFSGLPQPLRWHLGLYAKHMNKRLAKLIKSYPNVQQIVWPLGEGQRDIPLADDGFHPSAIAYAVWAETIVASIKAHQF